MNAPSTPTYGGNSFTIDLPNGWNDATLHVLEGPTVAGYSHSINIQTLSDVDANTLEEFADPFVEASKRSLRQAALLLFDTIFLGEPIEGRQWQESRLLQNTRQERNPKQAALSSPPPREKTRRPSEKEQQNTQQRTRQQNRPKGPRARRAILRWQPQDADQPHYQEQLFVLAGEAGYVLSASFTDQSRRELGADVERIMRSFCPLS